MDLCYSKAALLDALNARIPWATALDKKNAATHKKAEAAYLAGFKKAAREASKWDYETAKKYNFNLRGFGDWSNPRPSCPQSALTKLQVTINNVTRDGRKTYKVGQRGSLSLAHWCLTHDEEAKPDLCA